MRADQWTLVVALGGNAILQPGQLGTFEEQLYNIDTSARRIAALAATGHRVVVVHGNGPQIGNILVQQTAAEAVVAPMPMDVAGAMSQGQIGYLLAQTLENHLRRRRMETRVACLITETIVAADDPGFADPTKPVGPFYEEARARGLMLEAGWTMREDAGRGWRRVVPSPEPLEVRQLPVIKTLIEAGCLVVCVGGGGIPALKGKDGSLSGTAAVIDKDLAAARLALDIGADVLLVLTDVTNAYIDYRGPNERPLGEVTVAELELYVHQGHFAAGSMGPKVEAALRLARVGKTGIITSLTTVRESIEGTAGTRVVGEKAPGLAPAFASEPPMAEAAALLTSTIGE
jgi:carbamate kinase